MLSLRYIPGRYFSLLGMDYIAALEAVTFPVTTLNSASHLALPILWIEIEKRSTRYTGQKPSLFSRSGKMLHCLTVSQICLQMTLRFGFQSAEFTSLLVMLTVLCVSFLNLFLQIYAVCRFKKLVAITSKMGAESNDAARTHQIEMMRVVLQTACCLITLAIFGVGSVFVMIAGLASGVHIVVIMGFHGMWTGSFMGALVSR